MKGDTMSSEQSQERKHTRKSAQVLKTLVLGVGLVPFVLATPHQAPAEVVAQIDASIRIEVDTADERDPRALGQAADRTTRATGAQPRGPKLPPYL
jgi:hypothetical protein